MEVFRVWVMAVFALSQLMDVTHQSRSSIPRDRRAFRFQVPVQILFKVNSHALGHSGRQTILNLQSIISFALGMKPGLRMANTRHLGRKQTQFGHLSFALSHSKKKPKGFIIFSGGIFQEEKDILLFAIVIGILHLASNNLKINHIKV